MSERADDKPNQEGSVPLGTISECPSCGGDGKLHVAPGQLGPCWRCAGSGRVMAYRETKEQFDARMQKVKAFAAFCDQSEPPSSIEPIDLSKGEQAPEHYSEVGKRNWRIAYWQDQARIWEQRCHEEEKNATQHYTDLVALRSLPSATGAFYCDFKGPRCQEQCPVCASIEVDYKACLRRPEHGPNARADGGNKTNG